jgi:uncharacterized protein YndB with AHSA1/START domain
MNDRTVTITRRFAAAPDRVWMLWTTADGPRSWYAPLEGWVVGDAKVDARVGGGYRVTFGPEPEGDLYLEEGTYSVFEPVERLAWDGLLSGDGASDRSSIEIRFTADGDGTVLDITESGLSEESIADHEMGWNGALDRLEALLTA